MHQDSPSASNIFQINRALFVSTASTFIQLLEIVVDAVRDLPVFPQYLCFCLTSSCYHMGLSGHQRRLCLCAGETGVQEISSSQELSTND